MVSWASNFVLFCFIIVESWNLLEMFYLATIILLAVAVTSQNADSQNPLAIPWRPGHPAPTIRCQSGEEERFINVQCIRAPCPPIRETRNCLLTPKLVGCPPHCAPCRLLCKKGFHCVCGKCLPVGAAIPNHDVPDPETGTTDKDAGISKQAEWRHKELPDILSPQSIILKQYL